MFSVDNFSFRSLLAILQLLFVGSVAFAQTDSATVTPGSISLSTGSPVCTNGSVEQKACLQLSSGSAATKVDVFLLFDDTGSFAGFVPTVTSIFSGLVSGLETALPGVEFGFGVGRFEDFGGVGTGYSGESSSGRPFTLNQPIVTAATAGGAASRDAAIGSALSRTAPGFGGDGPESGLEALFQVATGSGFDGDGDGLTTGIGGTQVAGSLAAQTASDLSGDVPAISTLDPSVLKSGSVGGAAFRPDALKLVILATDICTITAFASDAAAPSTVSAGSVSESVAEFACSSTTPGSSRFGFVGDAVSSAANTVAGAVAPKGAATLPATIAALNAAGIRVLGIVTGSGGVDSSVDELSAGGPTRSALTGGANVPAGSGPSFSPPAWLSATARLTGGTDSVGDPLVFFIGSGGDVLRDNIVNAVLAAAKKPIDISLAPSGTVPSALSVGVTPAVVPQVAPGGQACFDVTFAGAGVFTGLFGLDFKDVASGLTLGSIPVSTDCPAQEFACTERDLADVIIGLDGGTTQLRNAIVRGTSKLRALGASAAEVRKFRAQGDALFAQAWSLAHTIPVKALSCTASDLCVNVSTTGLTAEYVSISNRMRSLVNDIADKIRNRGARGDAARRKKQASAIHKTNLEMTGLLPATLSTCSASAAG